MSMIKTYLAAPLFNDRERAFNKALAEMLSPYCRVFLPQRDGLLLAELLASGVVKDAAETYIFERDLLALGQSELLIAVLDGAHVDEGVAFEIGFAYGKGCLCIGIQTDVRRALPSGNNPMINRSLSSIFSGLGDLLSYVMSEHALRRHADVTTPTNL